MVQVDVFWSYGIGSAFALAAFRQLRKLRLENDARRWKLGWKAQPALRELMEEGGWEEAPSEASEGNGPGLRGLVHEMRVGGIASGGSTREILKEIQELAKEWMEKYSGAVNNEYFMKNLLFLSLLFVPSGAVLLWSNPSWETMQVGRFDTIPQWLVGVFSTANVTQGILAFLVTYKLLMKGKYYQATLQTVLAHTAFFFILVNGWDKTGYQRFLSKDRAAFDDWKWSNVFGWLNSDVMKILLTYGVAFIPLLIGGMYRWLAQGYHMDDEVENPQDRYESYLQMATVNVDLLTTVFGVTFANALTAHLLIRWFGWVTGGTAAAAAIYLGSLSKWGVVQRLAKRILKVKDLEAPPVWELVASQVANGRPAVAGIGVGGRV